MTDETQPDPFKRDEIIEWLKREGFIEVTRDGATAKEGTGYWDQCYSLSHSRPCLRIGVPKGQICATIALADGDLHDYEGRRTVYLGEAYTYRPIAALWHVLNLFDFDDSRDAAFWTQFHADSAKRKAAAEQRQAEPTEPA